MPMRILMVTNYQPPHLGGIEFAAQSLKRCWIDDGHHVTWLTTDLPRGALPATTDNMRIPALNVFERWWQINSPIISPLAHYRIVRAINSHDVINIHSFAPGLSSVALSAALHHKRPTVVTQHVGVIPMKLKLMDFVQKTMISRAARKSVKAGAMLTFVGKAVRAWFIRNARVPEANTHMTPAGIDQDTYNFVPDNERSALREKWGAHDEDLRVLFVGRFYEKKGLSIIRQLAEQSPETNFTLVGSGPIDPTTWQAENVRVLPFVSTQELRELYGSHDLFLMPSVGEGWPAVIPQAMACGLPCLISEETFEGFAQDPDHFLVRRRDPQVLVDVLTAAKAGELPLMRQRKMLSDYACNTWDWKRTARVYLDLFNQVRSSEDAPLN